MKCIKSIILSFSLLFSLPVVANTELKCLTDMAYVEAKSGGYRGIKDVIDVMFNRQKSRHFPSTICANLYMRNQYPWAKVGRPIRYNQAQYAQVRKIAEEVYAGKLLGIWKDETNGALFFNNHGRKPVRNARLVMNRRGHYFFAL